MDQKNTVHCIVDGILYLNDETMFESRWTLFKAWRVLEHSGNLECLSATRAVSETRRLAERMAFCVPRILVQFTIEDSTPKTITNSCSELFQLFVILFYRGFRALKYKRCLLAVRYQTRYQIFESSFHTHKKSHIQSMLLDVHIQAVGYSLRYPINRWRLEKIVF